MLDEAGRSAVVQWWHQDTSRACFPELSGCKKRTGLTAVQGGAGNSRDLGCVLGREEVEEGSKHRCCSVDLQVAERPSSWLLFLLSPVIEDHLGTKLFWPSRVQNKRFAVTSA